MVTAIPAEDTNRLSQDRLRNDWNGEHKQGFG
jgi:hypothetical protein